MARSPRKPDAETDALSPVNPLIDPTRTTDPQAYADAALKIINEAGSGIRDTLEANRLYELIERACEQNTGIPLSEAAKQRLTPLERFRGLLEHSVEELDEVEKSILSSAELSEPLKKKYVGLIARAKRLVALAKSDPVAFFIYVCRDQETGGVFRMAELHVRFIEIMTGDSHQHSMIWAPPGFAKSTVMAGMISREIGEDPKLRHLFLTDQNDKAAGVTRQIRAIVRSPRFRALYPDLRVLNRGDDAESSSKRFSVSGRSWMSRDTTFQAMAYSARYQGIGIDRLWCDDIVPPIAREQAATRRDVEEAYFGVAQRRIRNQAKGRIRIVGHPWHEEDVLCKLARLWQAGSLPNWRMAISEFAIPEDEQGNPKTIWEKISSTWLLTEKLTKPVLYQLQYRLNPKTEQVSGIKRVRYYPAEGEMQDIDKARLRAIEEGEKWLSVDPSATNKSYSSETGIIEASITANGWGFITSAWFLKLGIAMDGETDYDTSDPRGWLIDRIANAKPPGYKYVIIEAQGGMKGTASLFVDDIKRVLTERKCQHIPEFILPNVRFGATNNLSKMTRLIECKGYIEEGMVRFAGKWCRQRSTGKLFLGYSPDSGIARLVETVRSFTGAKYGADGVDALTQFVLLARDRLKNPSAIEESEPVSALPTTDMGFGMQRAIQALSKPQDTGEQAFYRSLSNRSYAA